MASRRRSHLLLFVFAVLVSVMGVLSLRLPAMAAQEDADGTILGDMTGPSLMGFIPMREGTLSEERQGVDPTGTTLDVVPTELVQLGMNYGLAAYDYIPIAMAGRTKIRNEHSAAKPLENDPGKMVAIDIDGDSLDEIAYYSLSLLAMTTYGPTITVFDPRDETETPLATYQPTTYVSNSRFDIRAKYPVQSWSSLFTLEAADLNGDGKEELVFLYAVNFEGDSTQYRCCEMFFDVDDAGAVTFSQVIYDISKPRQGDKSFQPYDPTCITVGDPDHDGCDEVVFTLMDSGLEKGYQVYSLDGSGSVDASTGIAPTPFTLTNLNLNKDSMLSVAFGDVDNDGREELVLGGYMDNELFLALSRWDDGANRPSSTTEGYSKLTGETGTHARGIHSVNEKYPDLSTSLYRYDTDSDYIPEGATSHAMYVNTCDWTVPLYAASLFGYENGKTLDQMFFGVMFYTYNNDKQMFQPQRTDLKTDTVMERFGEYEDNNLSIHAGAAAIAEEWVEATDIDAVMGYSGQENLLLYACSDRPVDAEFGLDGNLDYEVREYSYNAQKDMVNVYTAKFGHKDYFDHSSYPKMTFANVDGDTLRLKLEEHQFVYTEPTLVAAIMSPPYFQDIYDETGYNCGSTSYTQIEGSTEEETGFCSLTLDWTFQVGTRKTKVGPTAGGKYDGSWTSATTKEYWYTLSTNGGQDTVALNCVPVDVYAYSTYTYDESTNDFVQGEPLLMTFPCEPVTALMPVDDPKSDQDYTARVKLYNDFVTKHNEELEGAALENKLDTLPDPSEFIGHVPGDPSTYNSKLPGVFGGVEGEPLLTLDHGMAFGSANKSTTVIVTNSDSETYGGSFVGGLNLSREGWLKDGDIELSVEDGGSRTTVDYSGSSYIGLLNSLPNEYSDYYFACRCYAGTKIPKEDVRRLVGNDRTYVVVDYVLSGTMTCLPAQARNVQATGSSSESITVSWDMPWEVSPSWRADSYALERLDVESGTWKELVRIKTHDPSATFEDKGLMASTSYTYRVVAYNSSESLSMAANPSPPVSAETAEPPKYTVKFGFDPSHDPSMWAFRIDENGNMFSIDNGASVDKGWTIRVYCVAEEGYHCSGWNIYDESDRLNNINNEMAAAGVDLTDDNVTIPNLERNLYIEAVINPDGPGVRSAQGAEGPDAATAEAQAQAGGAPDVLSIDYAHDGSWVTDPEVQASIHTSNPAALSSLRYVLDTIEKGKLGNMPLALTLRTNGNWLLPAVAYDTQGQRVVREVRVMKDSVAPKLSLFALEQPTGTTTLRQQIVMAQKVGPSGIARVELLRTDDPNGTWIDVTDRYRSGLKDLEGGTYLVRLTNGAGAQTEASVYVEPPHGTQVNPQPNVPDPNVPGSGSNDKPNTPGGSHLPGGNGTDNGAATKPASGKGDGRALAPTGDPLGTALRASCSVTLIGAAVATGALLRRRRIRRR